MTVIPPANFWPIPFRLNGVLYANAPLSISSLTLSIAEASIANTGIVSTGAQGFAGAKNFNDGFTAAGTQVVTDISTDSTFVTATDVQLATKKAIKDYITAVSTSLSLIEPLYYSGTDLAIRDASLTTYGVLTTLLQNIAGTKNFNDGFTIGGTQVCTSISADSTFITATDAELSTKKAIKDYIGSGIPLNLPLYYNAGSIDIHAATDTTSGVLSALPQGIGGVKTFANDIIAKDAIELANVLGGVIRSSTTAPTLTLTSLTNGSSIELQSLSYGGDLLIQSSPTATKAVRVQTGSPLADRVVVDDVAISHNLPTVITSSSAPHLMLVTGVDTSSFAASGVGLSISASGPSVSFGLSNTVVVNNTTPSTSILSGALTVKGGLGVTESVSTTKCRLLSSATDSLYIEAASGQHSGLSVSGTGALTIDSTGSAPSIALSYNGSPLHILNSSLSSFNGSLSAVKLSSAYDGSNYTNYETNSSGDATIRTTGASLTLMQAGNPNVVCDNDYLRANKGLEINGALKYNSSPASYTLTGAGPFNDYVITTTKSFLYFTITGMTPAAHLTGLSCSGPPAAFRIVDLYFYSATPSSITIEHQGAGSLAGYRILCPNAGNLVIVVNPVAGVRLVYDSVLSRWAIMSFS